MNADDDAQVRQYILLLVNAAPPVELNLRKVNASVASAVTSIPPIPPALHKILERASLNRNEPVMFKLSSNEWRKQKPPVILNAHVSAAIAIDSTSQVSADAFMEPNGRT